MIEVMVVDDQAVVREGLRVILDAAEDLTVVAEAADGVEAVAVGRRRAPDVVLMDVRMPRMDGIAATAELRRTPGHRSRVVMLTTFGEEEYLYGALRAGATGFLLKDAGPAQIVAAVRAAVADDPLIAPRLTRTLIRSYVRRPPPEGRLPERVGDLTERELDVTRLVARGLSNAEIAEELVLSPGTVKTHVAHVLHKLGLRDRIQLVVLAYESGLVEPGLDRD